MFSSLAKQYSNAKKIDIWFSFSLIDIRRENNYARDQISSMSTDFDIAIIGSGMAGASLGYALRNIARIVIIEAESVAGYHTTGRSAAFYTETYGGPAVRSLTTQSKDFLFTPPAGFSDVPLVYARGALHIATSRQAHRLTEMLAEYADFPAIQRLSRDEVYALVPVLKPDYSIGGIYDPDCKDIDVAALHAGYLCGCRQAGVDMLYDAPVTKLKHDSAGWHIKAGDREVNAAMIVNAAGAWADSVATLAGAQKKHLTPMRRTVISFRPQPDLYDSTMPMVLDIDDRFYFKPDAGHIWASPADETSMAACDVQPDEIDIATIAARIEAVTHFKISRIERRWAGLRTFAPGRGPVFGFDESVPDFFWCAGQGGFGIQTAPAASAHCAALIAAH